MKQERISIIGGGVYGLAIANELANDFETVLLEKENTFANATSSHNQARLQEGYLYMANSNTAQQCIEGSKLIKEHFSEYILDEEKSYYLILNDSTFSRDSFEFNCRNLNLPLKRVDLTEIEDRIKTDSINSAYLVKERNLDLTRFLKALEKKASEKGAILCNNAEVKDVEYRKTGNFVLHTTRGELETDIIINATGPWTTSTSNTLNHKLETELLKTTFYEIPKIRFSESYAFVFNRKNGLTLIPNKSLGVTMIGRGDINELTKNPDDTNPVEKGNIKTLKTLKSLFKGFDDIKEDDLCPITGTKVTHNSTQTELRESQIIKHNKNIYSVIGSKLTSSLFIAKQLKNK